MDGMSDTAWVSAGVSASGIHEGFKYAEGFFSVHRMSGISWAVSRLSNIETSASASMWVFAACCAPMVSVSLVVVSEIVVSESVG